jgi:enoyl-CoA hydratase/carnithine racemase
MRKDLETTVTARALSAQFAGLIPAYLPTFREVRRFFDTAMQKAQQDLTWEITAMGVSGKEGSDGMGKVRGSHLQQYPNADVWGLETGLHLLKLEAGVAVVQIARPTHANAYDTKMLASLDALLDWLKAKETRVTIFQSVVSRFFCAGADRARTANPRARDGMTLESQRVFNKLAQTHMVTVAAVEGAAVGGGFEWALACDLIVAGPAARFWFPEVDLGLIPAAGGCTRLQSVVGMRRAKEIIICKLRLSAAKALEWGVVSYLDDQPIEFAHKLALEICSAQSSTAVAAAKLVINNAGGAGGEGGDSSLKLERVAAGMLYEAKLQRQAQIIGFGTALPPKVRRCSTHTH